MIDHSIMCTCNLDIQIIKIKISVLHGETGTVYIQAANPLVITIL